MSNADEEAVRGFYEVGEGRHYIARERSQASQSQDRAGERHGDEVSQTPITEISSKLDQKLTQQMM